MAAIIDGSERIPPVVLDHPSRMGLKALLPIRRIDIADYGDRSGPPGK